MKIDRRVFKSIVKECLLELLAEGLMSDTDVTVKESRSAKSMANVLSEKTKTSKPASRERISPTMAEAARSAAGADPIMANILADTAATTYAKNAQYFATAEQSMSAGERQAPMVAADPISQAVANSSPEEMFGSDTMAQWAALAFRPSGPTGNGS